MSEKVDIAALAALARVEVPVEELAKLEKEIPQILTFVEAIQRAPVSKEAKAPKHHNIMRDDADPHERGIYTKRLLEAAPARIGDRIAVKQVVSRKNKK